MFLGNIWKYFLIGKCDRLIGAAGVPRYHLEILWRFSGDSLETSDAVSGSEEDPREEVMVYLWIEF